MKKSYAVFFSIFLAFVIMGYSSISAQKKDMGMKMKTQSVTGEVMDLACYMGMNKSGPSHAQCAIKCAKMGIPFGIKDKKTGKLYLVLFGKDGNKKVYDDIGNQGGKVVTVKGMILKKDGLTAILVGAAEM